MIRIMMFLTVLFVGSELSAKCILNGGINYALDSGAKPRGVAITPDSQYVAVANFGTNSVSMFSYAAGALTSLNKYSVPSGSSAPIAVLFSSDSKFLFVVDYFSNDVASFPHANGVLGSPVLVALPSGSANPYSLAFSSNDTLLAVTNQNSDNVSVFRFVNGSLSGGINYALPSAGSQQGPVAGRFSSNGSYFVTADAFKNEIGVFSVLQNGSFGNAATYSAGSLYPQAVIFSSDGQYLIVGGDDSRDVTVHQFIDGQPVKLASYSMPQTQFSAYPTSFGFTPDQQYLLASGERTPGAVVIFTYSNGVLSDTTLKELPDGMRGGNFLYVSPNGQYLVVANTDRDSVTIFQIDESQITACSAASSINAFIED